jgi:hypothetical protein
MRSGARVPSLSRVAGHAQRCGQYGASREGVRSRVGPEGDGGGGGGESAAEIAPPCACKRCRESGGRFRQCPSEPPRLSRGNRTRSWGPERGPGRRTHYAARMSAGGTRTTPIYSRSLVVDAPTPSSSSRSRASTSSRTSRRRASKSRPGGTGDDDAAETQERLAAVPARLGGADGHLPEERVRRRLPPPRAPPFWPPAALSSPSWRPSFRRESSEDPLEILGSRSRRARRLVRRLRRRLRLLVRVAAHEIRALTQAAGLTSAEWQSRREAFVNNTLASGLRGASRRVSAGSSSSACRLLRVAQVRGTVKYLMESLGLDPRKFGAHSLRIGGATATRRQLCRPA